MKRKIDGNLMRLSRGLAVVFNVESVIKNRKKKN